MPCVPDMGIMDISSYFNPTECFYAITECFYAITNDKLKTSRHCPLQPYIITNKTNNIRHFSTVPDTIPNVPDTILDLTPYNTITDTT